MSILNSHTEAAAMAPYPTRGRKIAPPHPGTVIAGVLEGAGVGIREAARATGISHTLLAKICNGEKAVTAKTAVRLEKYFGNGPKGANLWLDMQRDHDLWEARSSLAAELAAIKPLKT